MPIRNINRTVGTILGSELTRRYGGDGTARRHDPAQVHRLGRPELRRVRAAGHDADARRRRQRLRRQGTLRRQDHRLPAQELARSCAEDNILIGNVALYGATGGRAFFRGRAGERFCVRNSGALAVVEGTGDHGCEYMTGGVAVVIGPTGRNFAAGMSGGAAFVFDETGDFPRRCNLEMVDLEPLDEPDDLDLVRDLLIQHAGYTGSTVATRLLNDWTSAVKKFVKVMPLDYRRVLSEQNPSSAARPDPISLEQWWQERYPGICGRAARPTRSPTGRSSWR